MISLVTNRRNLIAGLALLMAGILPAIALDGRGSIVAQQRPAVSTRHGMVVAQEKLAARVGPNLRRQGGNAVDAAVATAFAMAVTYPRAPGFSCPPTMR